MKLPSFETSRRRPRRAGSAVIVLLALLAIILIYVAANLRTLYSLSTELRLLERRQVQRLQVSTQSTNAASAARPAASNTSSPAPSNLPGNQ